MSGVVFANTLRRNWRAMLYWGIGLGIYALYATMILPSMDALKQYLSVVESMPSALLQAFGLTSDMTFMATPEGFLSFGFFGYAMIMLAVYAVIAGLNVTANEEDQGIMDILLSLPLPRQRIILEKFAAYTVLIIGITALILIFLVAGTLISPLDFDQGHIVVSAINMIPSTLMVLAFTICATSFIRSKSRATAVAAGFVTVSYLLNVIGNAAGDSIAGVLNRLSFFFYYDNNGVMQHGLAILNVIGLLVAALALIAAGVWAFQRRDVGI
jgi:beta-exotoxin I transport system permease protein